MLELALFGQFMGRLRKIINFLLEFVPEFPGVNFLLGRKKFVDLREKPSRVQRRKIVGKLLFATAILTGLFFFQMNRFLDRIVGEVERIQGQPQIVYLKPGEGPPKPMKKRYTILVLGKEAENRTDTIILCHLMVDLKRVHILSFPRDTRVPVLHNGEETLDKLSHTFRWGGLDLMLNSLSRFYGVRVDHTALIDLELFRKIVDTLGGVEIEVERDLSYEDKSASLVIDIKKGVQVLNGNDAEGYVRYRDEEGDLGRIRRQQKFIRSFLSQVRSLKALGWESIKILGRLPRFVMNLYKDIETDVSLDLFLKLIVGFSEFGIKDIHYQTLPGMGEYIYDFEQEKRISYFVADSGSLEESRKWFLHKEEPVSGDLIGEKP